LPSYGLGAYRMDKKKSRLVRYGLPTAVLDVKETAAYFSITSRQVYRLVRSGEIPHTRVGSSLRFRIEDLDRYLATRTTQTWTRVDKRGRPPKIGQPILSDLSSPDAMPVEASLNDRRLVSS
jgi:excisionase family DNA binding protein